MGDTVPGRGDNAAGVELETGHGYGLEKSLKLPGALEVDGWERECVVQCPSSFWRTYGVTQVTFTETGNCRKGGAGKEGLVLRGFPLETTESTFPGADCGLAGRGLNGVPRPCVRVKY